jgi:hypothetical protein
MVVRLVFVAAALYVAFMWGRDSVFPELRNDPTIAREYDAYRVQGGH